VTQAAIEVIAVGEVSPDLLHALVPVVLARFAGRRVDVAAQGLPRPDDAFVPDRGQYATEPIVRHLAALASRSERILGVADLDLYTPGLNFIFGQARPGGPAIVALARLRAEFWGRPPDPALLRERASKEAVHELAHSYGLGHCRDPRCVMWFSNTLAETDAKADGFCAQHAFDLEQALSGTPDA
jgi:archaemetzincin